MNFPVRPSTKSVPYLTVLAGAWFALALLVILALGLLLVGILTFWREWLEENWSLTFPTPLPWFYWSLFALIPLGVLLLYFLKLKRRALQVPSTFLWRKSIEDLHVNSLFQWLRKNILLILQLLALMGLGYALAAPTYNSEMSGRHIIIMIDNSASMSATDEKPSRLDLAKREALLRVEALDSSDQAMIVAFNSEAQTVQPYTNRKESLRQAIQRIEPTHRPTVLKERDRNGFEEAMRLAEGQANPLKSGEDAGVPQPGQGEGIPRAVVRAEGLSTDVYVYSDGRLPDLPEFSLGKLNLHLQTIGRSSNNIGIDRMNLRRDPKQPDQYEVEVRVVNFREQVVSKLEDPALQDRLRVELLAFAGEDQQDRRILPVTTDRRKVLKREQADGQSKSPQDSEKITSQLVTFSISDPGTGYVLARLQSAEGQSWSDDFALDDTAWLAIAPVRRARVLRIGDANDMLDAFVRASRSQGRATVTQLPSAEFATQQDYLRAVAAEAFDLVIFDRCAPASMEEMPQANTFFVGSAPPYVTLESRRMSDLEVKDFVQSHPFFRSVETLQGMTIDEARPLRKKDLPKRASALLETQDEPVLWALGRPLQRYTDLVMTFPLVIEDREKKQTVWNTNWPKQPAGTFPLFMDNVLLQLGKYKEFEDSIRPGVSKTLDPGVADGKEGASASELSADVLDPQQKRDTIKGEAGKELVYGGANALGVYRVFWSDGSQYRFAVNLFDQQESNIQPREEVQVGAEQSRKQEVLQQRRELWPWFAAAALALLLLEWYVYNRRIHV